MGLTIDQIVRIISENKFRVGSDYIPSDLDEYFLIKKTADDFGLVINKNKTDKILTGLIENFPKLKVKYNGAVVQIRGEYSVKSEYTLRSEEGFIKGELFVFQETVINRIHRLLVQKLMEEKALKLFPGCDEEYLYEAVSDTTENYLFETLKKVAKGLPIYQVIFAVDGTCKISELGVV